MAMQIINHFLTSVYLRDNRTGQFYVSKQGSPYVKFSIALGKTSGFLPCTSFSQTVVEKLKPFEGEQNMRGILVTMSGYLTNNKSYKESDTGNYAQFIADTIEISSMNNTQVNGDKFTSVRGVKTQQQIVNEKLNNMQVTQENIEKTLDEDFEEIECFWNEDGTLGIANENTQVENVKPIEKPILYEVCKMCNKNFVVEYEGVTICKPCSSVPTKNRTMEEIIEQDLTTIQEVKEDIITIDNIVYEK